MPEVCGAGCSAHLGAGGSSPRAGGPRAATGAPANSSSLAMPLRTWRHFRREAPRSTLSTSGRRIDTWADAGLHFLSLRNHETCAA
jgi:hypothetical protein